EHAGERVVVHGPPSALPGVGVELEDGGVAGGVETVELQQRADVVVGGSGDGFFDPRHLVLGPADPACGFGLGEAGALAELAELTCEASAAQRRCEGESHTAHHPTGCVHRPDPSGNGHWYCVTPIAIVGVARHSYV